MTFENIILIVAGALTTLMAGLFYSFSCAVNRGLGRLKDSDYLAAMQSINIAIINPLFLMSFLGAPVLIPLAAFLHSGETESVRFAFLLAASILYIIGAFGVTLTRNIPLNERLAKFDINIASEKEITATRICFEKPWNRWNAVRTIASAIAVILILIACLSN